MSKRRKGKNKREELEKKENEILLGYRDALSTYFEKCQELLGKIDWWELSRGFVCENCKRGGRMPLAIGVYTKGLIFLCMRCGQGELLHSDIDMEEWSKANEIAFADLKRSVLETFGKEAKLY